MTELVTVLTALALSAALHPRITAGAATTPQSRSPSPAPILTSKFENPHATITVRGSDKVWTVTLAPTSRMVNRGALDAMVAVGKTVSAYGYPSTVEKDEMRAERITVDGKTYRDALMTDAGAGDLHRARRVGLRRRDPPVALALSGGECRAHRVADRASPAPWR